MKKMQYLIVRIDKSINTVGDFKHASVFVRSQRQKYQDTVDLNNIHKPI